MKTLYYITLLLLSTQLLATTLIVGPAEDSDCEYHSINEALSSGLPAMEIHVSNQLVTNEQVLIKNFDLVLLDGGYASCHAAIKGIVDLGNLYTIIENITADNQAMLINYTTDVNPDITIKRFEIRGNQTGISVISSAANNSLQVNFETMRIHSNNNSGMLIDGDPVMVTIENTGIFANSTATGGGGIFCDNGSINIGELVSIHSNTARTGGGIHAQNCLIQLLAGDPNPIPNMNYGIYNNTASRNGGGLYLNKSELIGSGMTLHPISISNNSAMSEDTNFGNGGGIYVTSGSSVDITNIRLDANKATNRGGAIATTHNDENLFSPLVLLTRDIAGCNYGEICSSIKNNTVNNPDGMGRGAVTSQEYGGFIAIAHTLVEGNFSSTSDSVFDLRTNSFLILASDLIINNSSFLNLINVYNNSTVNIAHSTFSDNQISNYINLNAQDNTQSLRVFASIINNSEATSVVELNNGKHKAQIVCSILAHDDDSGIIQNQVVVADPLFIGGGNYKLQHNSPALDSNCIIENDFTDIDVRGQFRADDAMADIGAYEIISDDDIIFKNGFE